MSFVFFVYTIVLDYIDWCKNH